LALCEACGKRHQRKNKSYCLKCDPDREDYEARWSELLTFKQSIQRLESVQTKEKAEWRKLGESVRSRGQDIGDKNKELFELIK